MKRLIKELKQAKKSKISSWIDEVYKKIELYKEFIKVSTKVGLIKNNKYISGIPQGVYEDINKFYLLEDKLNYPKSHIVKINLKNL